jgi:hypothetical protein
MRAKDVLLAFFIVIVLVFAARVTVPLFLDTADSPTGQATQASSTICLNAPPELDLSGCNFTIVQNNYYTCFLNASDFDETGELTYFVGNVSGNLDFNITSGNILIAQPDNTQVGFNNVTIVVRDTSGCLNSLSMESNIFEVINVNDPPIFIPPLGPFEWELGETLRSIFLNNYFIDPDGDDLRFELSSVPEGFLITVTEFDELILSASACGEGIFTISAFDAFNASVTSSPISLSVPCTSPPAGGGGGGGGGSSCISNWQCSDWGRCLENGTQKKTCEDIAGCEDDERVLWRECLYIPQCRNGVLDSNEVGVDCGGPCPTCLTCEDGIQNQGELGVDCGGPCPICRSCFDGIQNFEEEGVDCGGACPACASCFDGIQNQNETGVDCGGSCPACTVLQTPNPIKDRSNPYIPWILGIVAALGVLALLYRLFYRQIHRFIARLILFFLRKEKKAILLDPSQRDMLLAELKTLERKNLLVNDHKETRALYQDGVGAILRKMFVIILGPVFSLEDAEESIQQKKNVSKVVKHLLHKQFIQLLSLEQDAVMPILRLQLHTELVRQSIFGYAVTNKALTAREVKTKSPKGSAVEQVESLLFNVALALQFGNITAARKNYLHALTLYDALTAPEQSLLFGSLHLTFDMIRYVAAYSK